MVSAIGSDKKFSVRRHYRNLRIAENTCHVHIHKNTNVSRPLIEQSTTPGQHHYRIHESNLLLVIFVRPWSTQAAAAMRPFLGHADLDNSMHNAGPVSAACRTKDWPNRDILSPYSYTNFPLVGPTPY